MNKIIQLISGVKFKIFSLINKSLNNHKESILLIYLLCITIIGHIFALIIQRLTNGEIWTYGNILINQTDFVIVGSIEEQDYYKRYKKNVFRFPQIENIRPLNKLHKNNKIINIGYHGNLEHLEEMSSSTKIALEKISKI